MSRIDARFRELRRRGERALVAYLTVGFPTVGRLPELVRACVEAGVDLVELGIPFSDPLADGPTIQRASERALAQGVSPGVVLRQVERLRKRGNPLPIALLTYYNPVLRYGLKGFCRDAVSSGADGLIIPDLPAEESEDLVDAARPFGLDTIFLAAPTSTRQRLARVVRVCTGFLYYVSLTGVTGARRVLPAQVQAHVRVIKGMSDLPVCVGFGVSRPEQVRQIVRVADGAIVGSALIELIGRSGSRAPEAVRRYLRSLKEACS